MEESQYVSIRITVHEAKNLVSMDSNGFSDPYCVVKIGKTKSKTKTIKKNLNPTWNQDFIFCPINSAQHQEIVFEVFDWDLIGKDDFLGRFTIPMSDVISGQQLGGWFDLEKVKHGSLRIKVSSSPVNSHILAKVNSKNNSVKEKDHKSKKKVDLPPSTCLTEDIGGSKSAAEKIIAECKKSGSKWEDPSFKKIPTSIGQVKTGAHPTEWKRTSEVEGVTNFQLFVNNTEASDVKQGNLGDCYLLSAMSVLATHPELLKALFIGVFPEYGFYQIKFFKNGKWEVVTIDDYVPMIGKNYAFSHCADINEGWVPLMEKAYAKLHGSYQAIESGSIAAALTDLTSEPAEIINFGNDEALQKKIKLHPDQPSSFWEELMFFVKEKYLIGCACAVKGAGAESDTGQGILANHAYGVLNAEKISKDAHLICLRNPWGKHEWRGKWSDNSSNWTKEIQKKLNYQFGDDGIFWMDISDFVQQYNQLVVCRLVTDDIGQKWKKFTFDGEWKGVTAGGAINSPTWKNNPQFSMVIKEQTEVVMTLSQPDARMLGKGKNYDESIGISVWKTDDPTKRLERPTKENSIVIIPYQTARDATVTLKMPPGNYVVIPSTFTTGSMMKFWLSFYSLSSSTHCAQLPQPSTQ